MFEDRRKQLEGEVRRILDSAAGGVIALTSESSDIDFKEESGRRGPKGEIVPGAPQNIEAAGKLADEVACFANTPGGGALIVGVEDGSGRIIGTELDVDWLRTRVFDAVQVAPDIREYIINGLRILVLFIAESEDPVQNRQGAIRWRVGEHCKAVDRSEWWQHRRNREGFDISASASTKQAKDVTEGAKRIIAHALPDGETHTLQSLLNTLGALADGGSNGKQVLTEASARAFTNPEHSFFEFTEITVPGGAAKSTVLTDKNKSAVEQLEELISLLKVVTQSPVYPEQVQIHQDYAIPLVVFREALLNAFVHMDWNRSEPISVQWFSLDKTLVIRSPGPFPPGITSDTILSHRRSRYPAFSDLFRALGYIEKSGLGVDRMYVNMVSLGFLPPTIIELPGKYVECTLRGGKPVVPMVELISHIRPQEYQTDLRVVMILDYLLRNPWLCIEEVKRLLQYPDELSAQFAIRVALSAALGDEPLLTKSGEGWVLGDGARQMMLKLLREYPNQVPGVDDYLSYWGSDLAVVRRVVKFYLRFCRKITSTQLCELSGMSRATAVKRLNELEEVGELVKMGQSRSTHYELP